MPRATIRFSEELHQQIQELATKENITVADIVRRAVSHEIEGWQPLADDATPVGSREIEQLHEQIQRKDEQISELHQLFAMSQKHSDELMKQLGDGRQQRSWWRFWERNNPQPA